MAKSISKILGTELRKALFMPPTAQCDIDAANTYLIEQLVSYKQ